MITRISAVAIALSVSAAANAEFCIYHDAFPSEVWRFEVTGSGGGKIDITGFEPFLVRAAYGSAVDTGPSYVMSFEKQFPTGQIGYYCDISKTLNSGPGTINRVFNDGLIDGVQGNCVLDLTCGSANSQIEGVATSEDL